MAATNINTAQLRITSAVRNHGPHQRGRQGCAHAAHQAQAAIPPARPSFRTSQARSPKRSPSFSIPRWRAATSSSGSDADNQPFPDSSQFFADIKEEVEPVNWRDTSRCRIPRALPPGLLFSAALQQSPDLGPHCEWLIVIQIVIRVRRTVRRSPTRRTGQIEPFRDSMQLTTSHPDIRHQQTKTRLPTIRLSACWTLHVATWTAATILGLTINRILRSTAAGSRRWSPNETQTMLNKLYR